MKLKATVSPAEFLRCVDQCSGEILYKTNEGDILNLKSQLSKYLFLIAVNAPESASLRCGEITCGTEDYKVLRSFFQE